MRTLILGFVLLCLSAFAQSVSLVKVAEGFSRPLFLTHAPADPRLFVLEQTGKILVLQDGRALGEPFLDLTRQISCCGERGLLGLAFHPQYRENGLFFVNYTNASGDTVVARYKVSSNPNRADAASAQILLTVEQPYSNHNGGMIAFGPDGMLYVGMGDGGSGGDPQNFAQNLNPLPGNKHLLGKMLRIDVNKGEGNRAYSVPADNPTLSGRRNEIWSYGWRNPWRFSFDRQTGDLWAADVGQGAWEEVHFQPASSKGGENYGWKVLEGSSCFSPRSGCNKNGLELPVLEYDRAQGQSITGGYRYRGTAMPALRGAYFYADFASGRLWAATQQDGKWVPRLLQETGMNISSFGEDSRGELYLIDYGGAIYRFAAR